MLTRISIERNSLECKAFSIRAILNIAADTDMRWKILAVRWPVSTAVENYGSPAAVIAGLSGHTSRKLCQGKGVTLFLFFAEHHKACGSCARHRRNPRLAPVKAPQLLRDPAAGSPCGRKQCHLTLQCAHITSFRSLFVICRTAVS